MHRMYMATRKKKPLRWRTNCIQTWRKDRHFTLETAAAKLSEPPYNLDYTHNSLGRIENGKQMPPIQLIEALAKLYDTDIDSLLNRPPGTAPGKTANGMLRLWDQAEPDEQTLLIDLAKRVVKSNR